MNITIGFDIYGTLIDTNGVVTLLKEYIGKRAQDFSSLWRAKQLEYSFRRGLMQNYKDFSICTRQALDYSCSFYKTKLSTNDKDKLMEIYRVLPAFPDTLDCLEEAKERGFRIYAFSNGNIRAIEELLNNANIANYFADIISVEDIKTFKPSPSVYSHFIRKTSSIGTMTWLISSNPFDVIGALSFGMNSAWVRRSKESIFDPWEIEPTLIVDSLKGLAQSIKQYNMSRRY